MEDEKILKALDDFKKNISCLGPITNYLNKVNFFEITGMKKQETKHSNFLAWLFDANETHGLGDNIVKKFLVKVLDNEKNKNKKSRDNLEYILNNYDDKINVAREKYDTDIFISSFDKFTLTIENKFDAPEENIKGKKQTFVYREEIEKAYSKNKNSFIFLTKDGIEASDESNWLVASYKDIYEIIKNELPSINNNQNISQDVIIIIRHYLEIIAKKLDILDDKAIINSIFNIYLNHKHALDTLCANRSDIRERIGKKIEDIIINELKNNQCVRTYNHIKEKHIIQFITKRMAASPFLEKYTKDYPFMYEIEVGRYIDGNQKISFELSGKILEETDEMENLHDISFNLPPALKGDDLSEKYCVQAWTFKRTLLDDYTKSFETAEEIIKKNLQCIISNDIPAYEKAVVNGKRCKELENKIIDELSKNQCVVKLNERFHIIQFITNKIASSSLFKEKKSGYPFMYELDVGRFYDMEQDTENSFKLHGKIFMRNKMKQIVEALAKPSKKLRGCDVPEKIAKFNIYFERDLLEGFSNAAGEKEQFIVTELTELLKNVIPNFEEAVLKN